MNSISLYDFEKDLKALHLDLNASEFYELTEYHSLTQEQIDAISIIFRYLSEKKKQATIDMYMKTSRLPRKEPKTFDNFDFSVIKGKDVERLKTLPSLSAIQAHKNLAFIGPPGTGKTHLAQAYGYECCHNGMKAYFIKMSELRDRFSLRQEDPARKHPA